MVTFARPRFRYDSYQDFWQLVALSGFKVIYLDEINWQETGVVIATPFNSEWQDIPKDRQQTLIWWNLERGVSPEPFDPATRYVPSIPDRIWASDRAFAKWFGAEYVFLGGHLEMGMERDDPQWDLVTLMYLNGRRQTVMGQLEGLQSADVPGGLWGAQRSQRLARTLFMVSAHQDDNLWSEPVRFMLAAVHQLPLVSETCLDPGDYKDGVHYYGAGISVLGTVVRALYKRYAEAMALAEASYQLSVVDKPFKAVVEANL